MEIKINIFLGRERFQWSGGDANQQVIFIWPYYQKPFGTESMKLLFVIE